MWLSLIKLDLGYDPYATAGAVIAMLIFLVWGAIRDKKFAWPFLIDSISGAIGGALLVPGLADIAITEPRWERFVAGFILALGVKFGVRQTVGKPVEKMANDIKRDED